MDDRSTHTSTADAPASAVAAPANDAPANDAPANDAPAGDTLAGDTLADAARRRPLSTGQEQLWFLDQLAPDQPTYYVCLAFRLRGPVSVRLLRESLSHLVRRHDELRAQFGSDDGVPFQTTSPAGEVDLPVADLPVADLPGTGPAGTGLPGTDPVAVESALHGWLAAESDTPFDLAHGPLYRFRVLRLNDDDHVLSMAFHHIVIDGWSSTIFVRELSRTYRALAQGRQPDLPPLAVSYHDYVHWQRDQTDDVVFRDNLAYWERQLDGLPTLDLPTDRPRPSTPSFRGAKAHLEFAPHLLPGLRAVARRRGVPLLSLLTAALAAVFSRYTGQEDLPLGATMLGRTRPEFEPLVGMFADMVVLRVDASGDPSLGELAERIADTYFDAIDHQGVPFATVVDRVQPVRDAARNPLFQVSVQLLGEDNFDVGLDLPAVTATCLDQQITRSRFDAVLNFSESAERLRLAVEYSTDLFDPWRVQALTTHLERVLAAFCADDAVRVCEVPLLTERERARLLDFGHAPAVPLPPEPVHAVVAARAAAAPDAIAALCRGERLTYGELDRRAGELARYLTSRGGRPEQIVAVLMERGLDVLVAELGILKAGMAFAVLDPRHPASRLDFMLRDTAAPVVVTTSDLADRLPLGPAEKVLMDRDQARIAATAAGRELPERATRDSLAYVLYTSGSTGKPKGVLIEHRALTAFIEAYRRTFDLGPGDRMLQLAALSFDMSQGEIFTGLCAGATLVLVPPELESSPDALAELMRAERVTYLCMSPAMLSMVDAEPYPYLRKIMAGGDVVPAELVNKWNLPGRRFVNEYGPTEAAVGCTGYVCEHTTWRTSPPIGTPDPGRRMYVVDRWGNLVPEGIPGELLIGGAEGLARGYLNQPELTAQRFVPDPFHDGGRVYRSGDLVRWTPAGTLEFLGRIDNQVKLHGLRVELGEIESVLLARPEVGMAAVVLRPDGRGDQRLVGYVTAADGYRPDPAELREALTQELPAFMVPRAWVVLDQMPLTTARKVDRAALPDPQPTDQDRPEREIVAPATPVEERVVEAFAEVLSLERVGATDDFFELGGNSLQAMRVVSRLTKTCGVRLSVRLLYSMSNASLLAKHIDALTSAAANPGEPGHRL